MLVEGLIKARPNRFIMHVQLGKKLLKCHCPVTGKIGNLQFSNISCLLSMSKNPERKTPCTVEAISLDPAAAKTKRNVQGRRCLPQLPVKVLRKERTSRADG